MLVSGVQQSDSVIHICICILFQVLFSLRSLQNIEFYNNSAYYRIWWWGLNEIAYAKDLRQCLRQRNSSITNRNSEIINGLSCLFATLVSNTFVKCHFLPWFSPWNSGLSEMATHSNILAWRIPWTEEPGGLLSMGSHRVGHDWSNLTCMHALEKEM